MVAATGYADIITVVDVVSRVTIFIPVTRLTAAATARALFTRWYPMFGPTLGCQPSSAWTGTLDIRWRSCPLLAPYWG